MKRKAITVPETAWDALVKRVSHEPTERRIDIRSIQRRERMRRIGARMTEFDLELKGAKLHKSTEPCSCGGNHYQLCIDNGTRKKICPVVFYLRYCQALIRRDGPQKMTEWSKLCPMSKFLKRINEDQDATYRKELECNLEPAPKIS